MKITAYVCHQCEKIFSPGDTYGIAPETSLIWEDSFPVVNPEDSGNHVCVSCRADFLEACKLSAKRQGTTLEAIYPALFYQFRKGIIDKGRALKVSRYL